MFRLFFALCFFISSIFAAVIVDGDELEIKTKAGFETMALYEKGNSSKDLSFVILHGKASKPSKAWYKDLASKLNNEGFTVISPKMPYSKDWRGSFYDTLDVVEELVLFNQNNNKKTILIGHSLGGATAFVYASKNNEKLAGIIPVAPGHMIHKSKKILKNTAKSVEKARKKVKSGDGDNKFTFKEVNMGKKADVKMSAKAYLSYYDPEEFPNIDDLLENIDIPVLWIAGREDRLTNVYRMEEQFEWLGNNDKNSYKLLKGKHKSVLDYSSQTIIEWSNKL